MEPASPRMTAQTREVLCDRILVAAASATCQTVDVTIPGADSMRIAILGWGSLRWEEQTDKAREFNKHRRGDWQSDGPRLKLEFSRVSSSRGGALTLVLDSRNGESCQVAYTCSRRKCPDDAICDLRCRESTTLANIDFYFADGSRNARPRNNEEALTSIKNWATEKRIDVVVWTALESNFEEKSTCKSSFSIEAARNHIESLPPAGKAKAAEYIRRAPDFIETPLRRVFQSEPWFKSVQ